MTVIDINKELDLKRCKHQLEKGGHLILVTVDENGNEKKYKVTLKGKSDDQNQG